MKTNVRFLKIYGERNSGANYLAELIALNTNFKILECKICEFVEESIKSEALADFFFEKTIKTYLGWKHSMPSCDLLLSSVYEDLTIVTITKNPYAYLLSLCNRPYNFKNNVPEKFSEFIRHPLVNRKREGGGVKSYTNPVFLWNKKNESYVSLGKVLGLNVINISYEELLLGPERVIGSLSKKGGRCDNGRFVNIIRSTKGDDFNFFYYKKYYLNKEWLTSISQDDLVYINSILDSDLMEYFNYDLES